MKARAESHLDRIAARIDVLRAALMAGAYVDTIEEARALFESLRNDAHVMRALRAERDELEYLLRRQKDLTPKEPNNG